MPDPQSLWRGPEELEGVLELIRFHDDVTLNRHADKVLKAGLKVPPFPPYYQLDDEKLFPAAGRDAARGPLGRALQQQAGHSQEALHNSRRRLMITLHFQLVSCHSVHFFPQIQIGW